jgi:hypothetical protein
MMIVKQSVECELAGKPKYSEKTCPNAVGNRRLTAWAMARPNLKQHAMYNTGINSVRFHPIEVAISTATFMDFWELFRHAVSSNSAGLQRRMVGR